MPSKQPLGRQGYRAAQIRALEAQNEVFRDALRSIGKNTCGVEPLAAAYARGILEENPEIR